MDGDPPRLAVGLGEHHRFLAEHEHGSAAKKMRGDDRSARRQRTGAIDDGDGIAAGVGHQRYRCRSSPSPGGGGSLAEGERGGVKAVGRRITPTWSAFADRPPPSRGR